jgi:DNA-binding NtrC family response regulator
MNPAPGTDLELADDESARVLTGSAEGHERASASSPTKPVVPFIEDGHVRKLTDIEQDLIRLAMNHYAGRPGEVARRLGIGRSTLHRRLVAMGLTPERGRHSEQ